MLLLPFGFLLSGAPVASAMLAPAGEALYFGGDQEYDPIEEEILSRVHGQWFEENVVLENATTSASRQPDAGAAWSGVSYGGPLTFQHQAEEAEAMKPEGGAAAAAAGRGQGEAVSQGRLDYFSIYATRHDAKVKPIWDWGGGGDPKLTRFHHLVLPVWFNNEDPTRPNTQMNLEGIKVKCKDEAFAHVFIYNLSSPTIWENPG